MKPSKKAEQEAKPTRKSSQIKARCRKHFSSTSKASKIRIPL
jgi:hypothetical protein